MATADQQFLSAWRSRFPHLPLEQRFAVAGQRVPLAYPPARLGIDLDAGDEARPQERRRVRTRRRALAAAGWSVVSFSPAEIAEDPDGCAHAVQQAIEAALDGRTLRPAVVVIEPAVTGGAEAWIPLTPNSVHTPEPTQPADAVATAPAPDPAAAPIRLGRAATILIAPFALLLGLVAAIVMGALRIAAALAVGLGALVLTCAGFIAVALLILGLSVWGLGRFLDWATLGQPVSGMAAPVAVIVPEPAIGTVVPERVRVIAAGLNVRSEPDASAAIQTVLHEGDELDVLARSVDRQWVHVRTTAKERSSIVEGIVAGLLERFPVIAPCH